jgi:hypothetical protein
MTAFAQAPQSFRYQAVARDATGVILANKQVSFKISIVQGTVTGAIVFSETHSKSTNSFGLVDLEVGKGTAPSGTFSTINWGNDVFFLKVELDPAGGASYQLMGTSQLVSVPYALYAKSSGSATETDPVFKSSVAKGITGADTAVWNKASKKKHYPGELFGGGIVFRVDSTGMHGLIASLADISAGCAWSNVINVSAKANSNWDGRSNTDSIVAQKNHTSSAAKLCKDYVSEGFHDWYLPAIDELILLFDARYIIDKTMDTDGKTNTKRLSDADYWSSTEGGTMTAAAFLAEFHSTYPDVGKEQVNRYVRAIRAF